MTEPMTDTDRRIDALSPEQRELLMRRLRERSTPPATTSAPALETESPVIPGGSFDPHQPSSLSDTQAAFWMGGTGLFDLGGSSANVFVEYEVSGNAGEVAERLNLVLAHAVARHPMLRTVVSPGGMQQILAETPPYEVELVNLGWMSDEEIERHLESTRERLRYTRHPADRWPLFDMIVFQLPGGMIRFQLRFDAMLVDGTSRSLLIDELARGVLEETEEASQSLRPPLEISYFDFIRALRAFRDSATWQRCREYWLARLPSLPPAPRLPLARDFGPETVPRIVWRNATVLTPDLWTALCRRAAQQGITPSGVGTAMLAETLRAWSEEPSFTLGLAGTYYPPVHPQIRQVIGTFTTLYLLEVQEVAGPFAQRARQLQDRLNVDLDHQHFSGHEALRELNRARRSGGRATLPIHFTSVLRSGAVSGQEIEADERPALTEARPPDAGELRQLDLMIAMPQVLLFWVLGESADGSLFLISQAVEELFPPGLVTDLIEGYCRLAQRLAEDESAWSEPRPLRLPAAGPAVPERTGETTDPALAELIAAHARERPEAPALVAAEGTISYGELLARQGKPNGTLGGDLAVAVADLRSGHSRTGVEAATNELCRLAALGPDDRLLALSLPGSDLWLCEIFAALATGAAVVLPATAERHPAALAALAVRERVTVCSSAPGVFEAALHHLEQGGGRAAHTLRRILLHRDGVPAGLPARLRALGNDVRAFATWGTTGAPIAAAGPVATIEGDGTSGSFPALRSAAGWHLHVLDRDLIPRPTWVPGDLYLSRGMAELPTPAGVRARRLPDGRIELLGDGPPPTDALGYGVDPRRIEAALQRHPTVRHAVVAWRESERRLVAWLLPLSDEGPSDDALRDHLRASFPEHLLPAIFVRRTDFPLTPEGRVDRSALEAPAEALRPVGSAWSPRETELAYLWEEVLGSRPATVDDDFFELGGNSILAARLINRVLERFGLEKPLASFLDKPTLARLADLVDSAHTEKAQRKMISETEKSPFRKLRNAFSALRSRIFVPSTSPAYGMRLFLVLWFGQVVSSFGTSLGSFSLGVWVVEKTGSATPFAMIAVVVGVAMLVLGPLSGALADRWDRRKIMLTSNLGSAVMTVGLASLMFTGRLEIWHIYPFVVAMVSLNALQGPALTSSISLIVPRRQLARASGMSQISRSFAGIIGPFAAGFLVSAIGYHGVIYIDCLTFLFAAATLLLVRIPSPPRAAGASGGGTRRTSILGDLAVGWAYIRERPGLLALLSMYTLTNFCMGTVQVLLTPLILSFGTTVDLGSVNSAAAGGVLLGSLTLSLWGGPQNRIWAIFAILVFQGCLLFLGGVEPSISLITLAVFGFMFTSPIIGGTNQAILQSKVAPEVQGRVFGMAAFIVACTLPLASALAGSLVDRVFQPLLSPGGALAATFVGRLVGVGPGRGVGLLLVLLGVTVLLIVGLAFLNPRLRRLETEIPDAIAAARPDPPPPAEPPARR